MERPILYSTPMAQAKRAGIKTQTRRIMKQQLSCDHSGYIEAPWKDDPIKWSAVGLQEGRAYCELCGNGSHGGNDYGGILCPYGKPGDILWGRETWGYEFAGWYLYKAVHEHMKSVGGLSDHRWKPSIHMPKIAAQLWDRIISIRVERLQDISEADAIAEGILKEHDANPNWVAQYHNYLNPGQSVMSPLLSYRSLWESINGPGSWDVNPWVWVITTEILSTNGRPNSI